MRKARVILADAARKVRVVAVAAYFRRPIWGYTDRQQAREINRNLGQLLECKIKPTGDLHCLIRCNTAQSGFGTIGPPGEKGARH